MTVINCILWDINESASDIFVQLLFSIAVKSCGYVWNIVEVDHFKTYITVI